jgi:hypothetical protein
MEFEFERRHSPKDYKDTWPMFICVCRVFQIIILQNMGKKNTEEETKDIRELRLPVILILISEYTWSRNNSVGIATSYGIDD